MLMTASGAALRTISVKRPTPSRGTSSTKKLGARSGTLRAISRVMLVWIAAKVTNKVSPNPSATTKPRVCAPGLCKLASATRSKGALGRGRRLAMTRTPHAIALRISSNAVAAPIKPSENKGSRAVPTASATMANMARLTHKIVRRSYRWPPSTAERNKPAAGTVRARDKGGRAKAKAMSRP